MIPATFVFLDRLPVTPNGKVDRRALSSRPPEPSDRPSAAEDATPQSNLEKAINTIWRDVLHHEGIGRHDNFFEVGGHSLSMLQVHTQLQAMVAQKLDVIDLFHYPTIASLAQYLSQAQADQPGWQSSRNRAQARREATKQRGRGRDVVR